MDYGGHPGFSGSNVVQRPHEAIRSSNDKWAPGFNDQSIWATDDEYGVWNEDSSLDNQSNSTYESGQLQSRSGSEPPNKKSRSFTGDSQGNVLNRDREISNRNKTLGRMFYKTKLCCKFREGTCPYTTNCNFAHGIEELRQPPPNWQEIIASQDEDRAQPREERQIPSLSSSGVGGETQRNYKGRHCKKFYTEEGCPYGDSCTFLHDEQSRSRESVAISLGPSFGSGFGSPGNGPNQKPSNWKTRICNKWEMTGYCPFGGKCHFAHGLAELHKYGGGLVDMETRDPSLSSSDVKSVGASTKTPTDTFPISNTTSVPHSDVHYMGASSQRSANLNQRQGQRTLQKWKGPDKISRIYGDWIDDDDYS